MSSVNGLIILTLVWGGGGGGKKKKPKQNKTKRNQKQKQKKKQQKKNNTHTKTTAYWGSLRAPDVKTSRDVAPATASASESFQSGMVRGRNE